VGRAIVRQAAGLSFSTSRFRIWTRSCACRCAPKSASCITVFRRDDGLRHARPGRGDDDGRPDRGDAATAYIQQIDAPITLYNNPVNKFVAGFIGSPPMNFIEGRIAAEHGDMTFVGDVGGVRLKVAESHRQKLEPYGGKAVSLGIRPEMFLFNANQEMHEGRSVKAVVEVVEPMGSEIYLYLTMGDSTVTARIDTNYEPPVNEPYILDVEMEKVHFFDGSTEMAIV
jgi:hypothetical protein